MHRSGDTLVLSATDVSGHTACAHLTTLEHARAHGGPKPPRFDDPTAEALRQRGIEHEARVLEGFRASGLSVATIESPAWADAPARRRAAEATLAAMRAGTDVIYQGTLLGSGFDGRWLGRPDFLRKVGKPSALGDWSYEVIDAKLSREAKPAALIQLCFYSELLAALQGVEPDRMHLALGGPSGATESFRLADYSAYYRSAKRRFLTAIESAGTGATYPEPVAHCDVCDWGPVCRDRWHADDHLSLVAGITRKQRHQLEERGTRTLAALARIELPLHPPLDVGSAAALAKVRDQARIQLEGRESGTHCYELFPEIKELFGLCALPAPSPGDLFLDFEGDAFAAEGGLEYLLGYADAEGRFTALWAQDRAEEKAAFERFVDLVVARLEQHPDLHVYHFAPYETTAIKRLAATHATRVVEVDRLLEKRVFVDLHRVVRQSLRASVESYSIKKLEPLYGFTRTEDLRVASSARAHFEAWLQAGLGAPDPAMRATIEGYNRDDVLSTRALRDWLEERRAELATTLEREIPRPVYVEKKRKPQANDLSERIAAAFARLMEGIPDEEDDRTAEQQARWVMAQLLEWHRREEKSFWWNYFHLRDMTPEELTHDPSALGQLGEPEYVRDKDLSKVYRYAFPPQEHDIEAGENKKARDPATEIDYPVVAVNDEEGWIELSRKKKADAPRPSALIPFDLYQTRIQRESLLLLAEAILAHGMDAPGDRARTQLLLREPPRVGQGPGDPLRGEGEDALVAALRLGRALDETVLPIQGPPGAGKTHTGAHMILDLVEARKRVGITANSHKVIANLFEAVAKAAAKAGVSFRAAHAVSDSEKACDLPGVDVIDTDEACDILRTGEIKLVGGVSWLWSRPDMRSSVDVLFVDEAGQMSLANVLACGQAARSLVLLGDPQQLDQPKKGVHPPGIGVSALEYLSLGASTLADDRGLFLDRTWRLHPDLCAFTSELYYEGRLRSREGLERQRVDGPEPLRGTGLRFIPVAHQRNSSESPEEVEVIHALVSELLDSGATWTDAEGETRRVGPEDVLVVTPYNDQVDRLTERLPADVAIGTVDKFQGQEAPIVIYSPASSSAADAPRGMEFLFNPNRLNVATSRARCLAVVVGSPELLSVSCGSVRQMELANGFSRLGERAGAP